MLMTSRLSRPGRDKKYNYKSLKDKAEKCERQDPSRTHANNMIIHSLHQGSVGLLPNVPFKFKDGEKFIEKISKFSSFSARHHPYLTVDFYERIFVTNSS
jgi:hypothetical protein